MHSTPHPLHGLICNQSLSVPYTQALWMQQSALTTAEVKRSPLTAVVALPAVLTPGAMLATLGGSGREGSSADGPSTLITASMYNDGGEELEVSAWHARGQLATAASPLFACLTLCLRA